MSKKSELVKNTAIIGFGKVFSQFIAFALLPLYTVFLTPTDYGKVDLIITYVSLLVPLFTIQIDRAAFRFLIDARLKDAVAQSKIITNAFSIVLGAAILVALVAAGLSYFVEVPYLWLAVATIVTTMFNTLFLQVSRGVGNNKMFAVASIITGFITFLGALLLIVWLGVGAGGILMTAIAANSISALFIFLALKLYTKIKPSTIDNSERREMLKYSTPLVPSGLSYWAIGASDRTLISIFMGVAANGVFAIANRYAAIFMAIYAIFEMSWTESASVHINKKDRDVFFSDVANVSLRIFGSLGLLIIATIALFFPILVAEQFSEAYSYIPLMVVSALMSSILGMYSSIYIAKKLTNRVFYTSVIAAIIAITFNLIFIPIIGLYSAAVATGIAYLAMSIMRHYDVKKYVKISYKSGVIFKIFLSYILIGTLYYMDNVYANIANIVLAIVIAVVMNVGSLKFLRKTISSRVRLKK